MVVPRPQADQRTENLKGRRNPPENIAGRGHQARLGWKRGSESHHDGRMRGIVDSVALVPPHGGWPDQ